MGSKSSSSRRPLKPKPPPPDPSGRNQKSAIARFFALDLLCLHWSLRYTTVANATLFLNFAPFFVALGAWAIFRELPARRTALSFIIAIGGIALLVGGIPALNSTRLLGD